MCGGGCAGGRRQRLRLRPHPASAPSACTRNPHHRRPPSPPPRLSLQERARLASKLARTEAQADTLRSEASQRQAELQACQAELALLEEQLSRVQADLRERSGQLAVAVDNKEQAQQVRRASRRRTVGGKRG